METKPKTFIESDPCKASNALAKPKSKTTLGRRLGVTVGVAAFGLASLGGLTGCQTSKSSGPTSVYVSPQHQHANDTIRQAVDAAQAGDFDALRGLAAEAEAAAVTSRQRRQAADLIALSAGADALLASDPQAAAEHWASISDHSLRLEVREGADAIGLHVPSSASNR